MNTVHINGKTYTAPDGVSISVINGKAYFDGKLAEDLNDWKVKKIEITIEGNCKEVKCDSGNINVNGNVEGDVTTDTGNINVRGDIKGNVTTDTGNIKSHHIFGNASTDIGNINGVSGGKVINCNNKTYSYRTKKINWFR
jgi:cytoskeletal protein CcmA (bactofilin family)